MYSSEEKTRFQQYYFDVGEANIFFFLLKKSGGAVGATALARPGWSVTSPPQLIPKNRSFTKVSKQQAGRKNIP